MSAVRPSRARAGRAARSRAWPSAARPGALRAAPHLRSLALATAICVVASGAGAAAVDSASEGTIDGRVLISPLALTLVISPTTIHVGDFSSALVTASNQSGAPLGRTSIRLRTATGLIVRGRQPQTIRSLAPGLVIVGERR